MSKFRPDRIAVGVPVRNEARRLPRLLNALARQDTGGKLTVCFLLDGCLDDSEALLTAWKPFLPFEIVIGSLPYCDTPNAGRARRAAMRLCKQVTGREAAALLTTDADSAPATDWVRASCSALEQVDVVAGHIRRTHPKPDCWRTRLEDYLEALHTFRRTVDPIIYDPLPSHPSLGGASLGFRSDVYETLDGFPPLAQGEDREIVARARREGFRVRHDPAVLVVTSGRTTGRAIGGLADQLRTQLTESAPPLVPDPGVLSRHFEKQAALRRAFEEGPSALILTARQYGFCDRHLQEAASEVFTSDAFVEIVAPDNCLPVAAVLPLPIAETSLARLKHSPCPVEVA